MTSRSALRSEAVCPNRDEERVLDSPSHDRRRFLTGAALAVGALTLPGRALFAHDDHGERSKPVWTNIELTKENGQWIVNCKGKGDRCAILRLVTAKRLSAIHPVGLAAATIAINAILQDLVASNRDATRHPGFIVTPHAPFLAWMRTTPGLTNGRGVLFEDGPEAFYQAIGVSYANYKPKPTRYWVSIGEDKVKCKKGGDTQKTARLMEADRLTNVHDAVLKVATTRINAVLDRYARSSRNPAAVLSLFATPRGLFLVWSEDDNSDGPPPRGAVTAESDEAKVLQALGI